MSLTRGRRWFGVLALASALVAWVAPPVFAETLREVIEELVQTHKRIKASEADVVAARERSRVALGSWFPTLDVTANYGYEIQNKGQGATDTFMPPRAIDLSITQLLWDFGSTNTSVDQARLLFDQSRITLTAVRQALINEGVIAYLDLIRASKRLDFARASVANIKRQAELENARVQRGSGFATDVLQAKTQLAGAEARRVQEGGTLNIARNRYRAVFGETPPNVKDLVEPKVPLGLLPASREEAVRIAAKSNPQLIATRINAEIARKDITKTRANQFLPSLNAIAESNHK